LAPAGAAASLDARPKRRGTKLHLIEMQTSKPGFVFEDLGLKPGAFKPMGRLHSTCTAPRRSSSRRPRRAPRRPCRPPRPPPTRRPAKLHHPTNRVKLQLTDCFFGFWFFWHFWFLCKLRLGDEKDATSRLHTTRRSLPQHAHTHTRGCFPASEASSMSSSTTTSAWSPGVSLKAMFAFSYFSFFQKKKM
jgi:hypothetical protein